MPRKVRAGRLWEAWYPWIGGAVAAFVVYHVWAPHDADVYKALDKSLSSAVDAAAVLAGFQGTALSLLLTLVNTPPIRQLRKLKLYRTVVRFHAHAIFALLGCVAVSMILLGIMGTHTCFGSWSLRVAATVAFVAVAASLAAFRVTYLMVRILARHGDSLGNSQ